MNKWEGVGRLAKDVDFRQNNDLSIARFTVACDRKFKRDGEPTADFINCVAFGKTADFVNKYFIKGSRIGVTGHIQTGSYTNREGNKVYTTEVAVEDAEFVESKNASQQTAPQVPQQQYTAPPQQQYAPQPQYQQQYQQAPPQNQPWMQIPPGSAEENPFN